jgi:hypothetical protein
MQKNSLVISIVTCLVLVILFSNSQVASAQTQLTLPQNTDWVTKGVAIREGAEGQWDRYLWGGFSNNLIKKGSTYYHYYQGSAYYDNTCESVAYRAIGVATSTDGINWTKHSGNPVIKWSSKGSIEEGASGSGAWLRSDGKVYIYYGANTGTGCTVNTAGRLAVSSDGVNFTDMGQVISPTNSNIWGYGDEIHPVGVYEYGGKWNVFYIPNGVSIYRKLGVVSGNSSTNLTTSSAVNSGNLSAWGTVSTVLNGSSSYAFVNDPGTGLPINAYRFDPTSPANMTLEKSYTFSDCQRGSVIHDGSQSRWLMLCRESANGAYYLVKTAPSSSQSTATPTPTITPTKAPTQTPTPTKTATPTPTPSTSTLISNLIINDSTNAGDWSIQNNLQVGNQQYGDRLFKFTNIATSLAGSSWIRTANDSKSYTSSPVATFKVNANATVYIAHDDRLTTKPSWLSTYTDTGINIVNDEPTPSVFSVFSKTFLSGSTVTLGINGTGDFGMYTVIVKPASTTTPTFTPTPILLLGDINNDGVVNIQDYVLLSNAFGTNNSSADLNKDGIVNIQDYVILSNNFGKTI